MGARARRSPLLLAALALSACGGDTSEGGAGLSLRFSLFDAGRNLACTEVSAVREVEVLVLTADGLTPLPGFPKAADCATGTFSTALADGRYTLQITAYGQLGADPNGSLFESRTPIELPRDASLEVSLEPQIATLELGWAFEVDGALGPCADEVDEVSITVSSGTGGDAVTETHGCSDGPVRLGAYLRPRTYTVLVEAFSAEGFRLYQLREMRVLERGPNTYSAVLEPEGGRLRLGWRFAVPAGAPVVDCADPGVAVDGLSLRVTSQLGDEPVEERIACTTTQPYAVRASRFTRGRMLELELIGEGVHRYRAAERFTMPDGDRDLGVLTLRAVGSATVAWTVTATSACANRAGLQYAVRVVPDGAAEPAFESMVGDDVSSVRIAHLPYGPYQVSVTGRAGSMEICRSAGARSIERRVNAWAPFAP